MCKCVGRAEEFNDAWQFRQKDLNDFNILYKHQMNGPKWILVLYSSTGTWPEGVVPAVTA